MHRAAATGFFVLCLGLATGCSKGRAPFLHATHLTGGGASSDGGLYVPPPIPPSADASGLCGNDIVPIVVEHPNFYFVIDSSGSMGEGIPPDQTTTTTSAALNRYDAARVAIQTLLEAVGHRVSYGAWLYPADTSDGCSAGKEVFPMQPGDPVSYARTGKDGKVLLQLLTTLHGYDPNGATPTAAALAAVKESLGAVTGRTYAFLLTDGAPNCNLSTACGPDSCTVNIEGQCPVGMNCCDPAVGGDQGLCLDANPTVQAVEDLASAGIQTYVIGMPGTDKYGDLLDRLAAAGQTARAGTPAFYLVKNAADLTDTLAKIGLAVALSCDVPLGAAPPNDRLVNVFFDQTIVPQDDKNGWTWADASTVRLVGSSCDDLKSGAASQLQIVAGCPTITR